MKSFLRREEVEEVVILVHLLEAHPAEQGQDFFPQYISFLYVLSAH